MVETCASSSRARASSRRTDEAGCEDPSDGIGPSDAISPRAFSSSVRMRSFSSPAAFSVNVTATMSLIFARPVATSRTMRATSSVVLPVPAAASTTRVSSRALRIKSRSTASSRTGVSRRVMGAPLRYAWRRAAGGWRAGARDSRQVPQREQVGEEALVLLCRALLLEGAAHRAVVAVVTGAGVGGRREEPELHAAVDHFEGVQGGLARDRIELHRVTREAAGLRAVVETSCRDRLAGHLLDDETVEDRLQRSPAVDRGRDLGAVLAGLVIGD